MGTLLEKKDSVLINESFSEICMELDNRKNEFEKSWRKWDTIDKVWDKFLARNTTFLTSK